jgi:hypothetical protein
MGRHPHPGGKKLGRMWVGEGSSQRPPFNLSERYPGGSFAAAVLGTHQRAPLITARGHSGRAPGAVTRCFKPVLDGKNTFKI